MKYSSWALILRCVRLILKKCIDFKTKVQPLHVEQSPVKIQNSSQAVKFESKKSGEKHYFESVKLGGNFHHWNFQILLILLNLFIFCNKRAQFLLALSRIGLRFRNTNLKPIEDHCFEVFNARAESSILKVNFNFERCTSNENGRTPRKYLEIISRPEGFLRMKFDFVFPVKGIGAVGRLDQIDTNNNNNEEYDD